MPKSPNPPPVPADLSSHTGSKRRRGRTSCSAMKINQTYRTLSISDKTVPTAPPTLPEKQPELSILAKESDIHMDPSAVTQGGLITECSSEELPESIGGTLMSLTEKERQMDAVGRGEEPIHIMGGKVADEIASVNYTVENGGKITSSPTESYDGKVDWNWVVGLGFEEEEKHTLSWPWESKDRR